MDKREILLELLRDKPLAHGVLFARRHSDETPAFHLQMLRDWYSPHRRVLTLAFRGGAKSTRAEEAIIIEACERTTTNIVIVGESEARAVDRLRAIKFEFETNEMLEALFDIGQGSIWGETKIVLSNGVMIQAYGRGQSLRGIKYLNARPGLIFCDDLETEESVRQPETRRKTLEWFMGTLLGSLDRDGRVRVAATPLDPDSLAMSLTRNAEWQSRVFPIEYLDANAQRTATWSARFPLDWIDAKRREMAGMHDKYMQEYMCQAVDPATRVFRQEDFRTSSRVPSWHAVYAVYDPARTVHARSATTGKVVFSWIGRRLVFWEADAQRWLPSQIIEDMFRVNQAYHPVLIGIEETGLNEFIREPLRRAQIERATLLPIRNLNAPRGKLDFIRGLQPFFAAHEVEFAPGPTPAAAEGMRLFQNQLLSFPTGEIDAPNAAAYALTLQPQQLVYDFDGDIHIDERLSTANSPSGAGTWLAINATNTWTSAVLCRVQFGVIQILADWLHEGDPGQVLADIVKEAQLEATAPASRLPPRYGEKGNRTVGGYSISGATNLRFVAPVQHWDAYDTIGLRSSAARIPIGLDRGAALPAGRDELRDALSHSVHGRPAFAISPKAQWTLRALAGGYAYRQGPAAGQGGGRASQEPTIVEGPYSLLMNGLEAWAALLRADAGDSELNYDYTRDGRKYISALAR